jgi:cytochrome c-type biogenesis protein CcmH
MLALADALAMIHEGNMTGRPESLVREALNILPKDPTALWLAGLAAEQAGRNREAYDHWTTLLPLLDQDPQSAMEVRTLLTQLRQKQPDLPEFETTLPTIASASEASVTMSIALAPSFSGQVNGDDLVFVYAKAASGPPMPLAAKRLKVSDLPLEVTLGDGDAMMPQMKLSGFDQVILGARVSMTGDPVAQAGDLYIESAPFNYRNASSVVELEISHIKQ